LKANESAAFDMPLDQTALGKNPQRSLNGVASHSEFGGEFGRGWNPLSYFQSSGENIIFELRHYLPVYRRRLQ
jgi:hypothetical protein